MADTLANIAAKLNPLYDPKKKLISDQIATLPGQEQEAIAGLDAAKTNAFGDIATGANRRGVLYSGVPIDEQSRYVGSTYIPAVANAKSTFAGKRTALESALLDVSNDQSTEARNILNQQEQMDLAREEAATKARAAAAANAGLSLGGLLQQAAVASAPKAPTITDNFNSDVSALLDGYKTKFLPGYTERTVIPKLQKLYPELDPNKIKQMVYGYRKATFGE